MFKVITCTTSDSFSQKRRNLMFNVKHIKTSFFGVSGSVQGKSFEIWADFVANLLYFRVHSRRSKHRVHDSNYRIR